MDFGDLLPPRPIDDILTERIRLMIGEDEYVLPVLTIAENRAWKERMDLELGWLIAQISESDDTDAILRLFDGTEPLFLDLLVSYDERGVLPAKEDLEHLLTPIALLRATLEVWRAARPLADIASLGMSLVPRTSERPSDGWLQRTRRWLRSITGRPASSSAN